MIAPGVNSCIYYGGDTTLKDSCRKAIDCRLISGTVEECVREIERAATSADRDCIIDCVDEETCADFAVCLRDCVPHVILR